MTATDLAIIRNHNYTVIRAVDAGFGTVEEIAEATSLSAEAINAALDRLINLGELVED